MSFSSHTARAALLLGALSACGPAPRELGPADAQTVTVGVEPRSAELRADATLQLAAIVTGTADTTVTWEVVEVGGGSVDAAGLYTAPAAAGVFHVRARSRAAPAVSGESTVTVALPVTVAVSPSTASVAAGGTVAFTAAVANAANAAVTWSVPGAGCGTITQAGVYTAPLNAGVCTVVATSVADPARSASATVTVTVPPPAVVVTVTPSPAAVDACTTLAFSATVTGATNRSVTWSVQEGAAGGAVTAAGVYTAPSAAGTYHVVATSQADPTKSAVVPVDVTDKVLSVAVSPPTVQVPAGGTAQFVATVTTTCGAVTATKTITSAGEIVAN